MPTTPNLELNLPTVGANRDTWGALLNDNFTTLDEFVQMAMPCGAILDYAGPNPPPGWLICDGRQISRTTYSQLFAALGTYWGAGDGSTTFNLPRAQGRASVGPGGLVDSNGVTWTFGFASYYGAPSALIGRNHLPAYNMVADVQGAHSHGGASVAAGGHSHVTDQQGIHWHGGGATGAAGTHAHGGGTNLQGDHNHTVSLWGVGAGGGGGGISVMSDLFGAAGYTTSVNGAHTHAIATDAAPNHTHGIATDGGHQHTAQAVSDHTHAITADGGHVHNVNLGGGAEYFTLIQPVLTVTKIIYAGSQAAVAATTAAVPLVRRLMSAPMRGSH